MRILLLCEGTNEEMLLNILLDNDKLIFDRDDLIGRRPYPVKQLRIPSIKLEIKHYGHPIKIYRVGDKQNERITIPFDLKNFVSDDEIYKFCTKPELEMLLILNEKLEKEFEKVKSNIKAKSFAKEKIRYNGIKYDQSTNFLEQYYGGKNVSKLVDNIKRYKSYKKHKDKTELYLADLLKK